MERKALETWLHRHIPLSQSMRVKVLRTDLDRIVLHAPLRPNRNHQQTAFGGSLSALMLLAAWSLIHSRLHPATTSHVLVVRRLSARYHAPVTGPLRATARLAREAQWRAFERLLRRRGKARLTIGSVIEQDGRIAARFEGEFVAYAKSAPTPARRVSSTAGAAGARRRATSPRRSL